MIQSGIYMFENIANGKKYIGQSKNLRQRYVAHLVKLRKSKHSNKHLQGAFNEYGMDIFKYSIIEILPEDEMDAREQYWISYYNSICPAYGYNNDTGGKVNRHHSDHTKKRLSEMNKGKTMSAQSRAAISKALKGRIRSDEHRRNLSIVNKGKRPSDKCIALSILKHKGTHLTDEQKENKRIAWLKSEASHAALKCTCENNKLSLAELEERAAGPRPDRKLDDMKFQNWWKARKRLGLPTKGEI